MTVSFSPSISAAFAQALPYGHRIAVRAEIWQAGVAVWSNGPPVGFWDIYGGVFDNPLATFAIEQGSTVTVDRRNIIRRTASVVLTDFDGTVVPTATNSTFAPYGNEVILYRGITYDSGDQELIPLGVFGIETLQIDDSIDLKFTISASDRARAIQRAGFRDVFIIPANYNVAAAIQWLIIQSGVIGTALPIGVQSISLPAPGPQNVPFLPSILATCPYVTQQAPLVYKPGDDPWKAATDLALAAGFELFFDATGTLILHQVTDPGNRLSVDPTTGAVIGADWQYEEGAVNIASALTRKVDRTTAANYIIRDGQGSGIATPVRGVAHDDKPNSPTYYLGSYGTVIDYASSALYVTQAQAQAAAEADLIKSVGTIESLNVIALVKPDHDVDDVIEVTRARSGLQNNFYVVDGVTIGTSPSDGLALTTRFVIPQPTPGGGNPPPPPPPPLWVRSIDTMKESKDAENSNLSDAQIANHVNQCAALHVSHITVNTHWEYQTGNSLSNGKTVMAQWVAAIRAAGKKVFFRPGVTTANSGIARSVYLQAMHDTIVNNPTLFQPGDILDGDSEAENSAYFTNTYGSGWESNSQAGRDDFNQFLQNLTTTADNALATIGRVQGPTSWDIMTWIRSTDPGTAVNSNNGHPVITTATVQTNHNTVTVDIYPDKNDFNPSGGTMTDAQLAQAATTHMTNQLASVRNAWPTASIMIGEYGYCNSAPSPVPDSTQTTVLQSTLAVIGGASGVVGLNYWVGAGGSGYGGQTNILVGGTGSWTPRPAATSAVSPFYASKS